VLFLENAAMPDAPLPPLALSEIGRANRYASLRPGQMQVLKITTP